MAPQSTDRRSLTVLHVFKKCLCSVAGSIQQNDCYFAAHPMDQQLTDVNKNIEEVEKAMSEQRSAKPEGWQDEVKYLREKEKQLREEKLLLLRKSDV